MERDGFGVEVRRRDGLAYVRVSGELCMHTSPRLRATIWSLFDGEGSTVILDLGAVEMIDSSGLHFIMEAKRRAARTGCRLLLGHMSSNVSRVMAVTGLDKYIDRLPEPDGIAGASLKVDVETSKQPASPAR